MTSFEQLQFDNIYSTLSPAFYSRHQPSPLQDQFLIHFNAGVASMIGLDPAIADHPELSDLVTRPGQVAGFDSLAMCYSGHQFGNYAGRLGDGRALLLGQIVTADRQRWDLQLKGSGLTLYSRQGDGKAVLRSTIREHLCSAAMHGLGIPTTHSLAMFGSEEEVYREQIEPGAMLIRVARSHIRFGSFEHSFYSNRHDDLREIADFTIAHYFNELEQHPNKYLALLDNVISSTAQLIAQWQSVGFCHGVMNSDNMSIHGITIDYGPFGFLDAYDPRHICNHSDYHGRYAFAQQPRIGLFNLSCLAQALLPLIDTDPDRAAALATASLESYSPQFDQAYVTRKRSKLGLYEEQPDDDRLYDDLLSLMAADQVDFTLLFRTLSEQGPVSCRDEFVNRMQYDQWCERYIARLSAEIRSEDDRSSLMRQSNPKYVLRNYLAENAIRLAQDEQDYREIERLVILLGDPYHEQQGMASYAGRPPDWANTLSVSCSS